MQRVAPHELVHDVDLPQQVAHRPRAGLVDAQVDTPEHAADLPQAQAPEVGMHGRLQLAGISLEIDGVEVVVDPLQVLPGHVVVPVDERNFFEGRANASAQGIVLGGDGRPRGDADCCISRANRRMQPQKQDCSRR